MKIKIILILLLSSFNIFSVKYEGKINTKTDYCIGIGKSHSIRNAAGIYTMFKAKLCRMNERIFRDVVVFHQGINITENYDVREKLVYYPRLEGEYYYDSNGIATYWYKPYKKSLEIYVNGNGRDLDAYIEPISVIDTNLVHFDISDLKLVYGENIPKISDNSQNKSNNSCEKYKRFKNSSDYEIERYFELSHFLKYGKGNYNSVETLKEITNAKLCKLNNFYD